MSEDLSSKRFWAIVESFFLEEDIYIREDAIQFLFVKMLSEMTPARRRHIMEKMQYYVLDLNRDDKNREVASKEGGPLD